MEERIRKYSGANIDIDLTSGGKVNWKQSTCPWNKKEGVNTHKCAIKNISICKYFRGIEPLDTVLCSFSNKAKSSDS